MTPVIVLIAGQLPEGLQALKVEALADGHRHIDRLINDFQSGKDRFDRPGEALVAAYLDGQLVGIGGVTQEPIDPTGHSLRMRRLYVALAARRQGIAQALARTLLDHALTTTRSIRVHAGNPDAAAFWEAQGYVPAEGQAWSHVYPDG